MNKKLNPSIVPKVLPVVEPDNVKAKYHHPHLPQVGVGVPGGGSLLLMISPVKTGKCVYEYTLVETDTGNKYIKNIKVGDKVLSDKGYVKVDNVFKQGKKKCYKIILYNECELILTEEHKLHTINGMKEMKDCYDDTIITNKGNSKIKSKEYYSVVECYDLSVDNENHRFYANDISVSNSTIISNLLLNDSFFGQEYFDDVQIISNTIKNDVTSRFLNKAFNVYDYYSDDIIDGLIDRQKSFEKKDQPQTALILDDCLGSIKRESKINHICSRYRHFNIKLLVISSQKFKGSVSPVVRANATDVIIGSPFPNQKELLAVAEEYGDLFNGPDNWLRLYRKCCPNKYDFCYMDLQSNPHIMYSNFEKQIAIGGFADKDADKSINTNMDDQTEEEIKK